MSIRSYFWATLFALIPGLSAAQFVKDDGTSPRAAPVTMQVVHVSPGVADLVWQNAGVNFLHDLVVPAGITAVRQEQDTSGKGVAKNVNYSSHPDVFASYRHCVTVAGPNNYAGGKTSNARWDMAKTACNQAATTVTVRVSFGSARNEVFGIVPALLTADGQFVGWAWHGTNSARMIARPGAREPDMVTVLAVDANGTVRLANDAEFQRYQGYYAKMF